MSGVCGEMTTSLQFFGFVAKAHTGDYLGHPEKKSVSGFVLQVYYNNISMTFVTTGTPITSEDPGTIQ